jgi:putative FmdB family regulatory protein
MPLYEYQCVDCGQCDQRVAGLDDHFALCVACGGLMARLDDPWTVDLCDKEVQPCVKS